MKDRGAIDTTLAAMFSNPTYSSDYLFYAHMIGQCSIKMDSSLPAPAGVAFNVDHYNLYINPDAQYVPLSQIKDPSLVDLNDIVDHEGTQCIKLKGFDDYTLPERLAILKHEMLHILYNHVSRMEDRKMPAWNYATDCALNQQINQDHLPKGLVDPKSLAKMLKIDESIVKINESSEFYYELIKKHAPEQEQGSCDGDCENCPVQPGSEGSESDCEGGSEGGSEGSPSECPGKSGKGQAPFKEIDDHGTWKQSNGDGELQQDITKKMIEKSQSETIKGRGNVPASCSGWLEMFTRKAEVNWKKVLRGIVGNKRVGRRSTIMKSDRRFPKREELRGKTKDRMFNLLVVADVSGSMNDKAVLQTLGEVRHICDITKTAVDLIQIDTVAYPPEKLSKSTKLIERKGCGGTNLHPALEMAKQHGIDYQAIVVLTDGGLFDGDIEYFKATKKKVIWLIESGGYIMNEMNDGRMQAFQLKDHE